MSLVLYAAPFSSAIPVVHAVKELKIECEIRMLDLTKGEQKKPEFLALNPNGVVPTLVADGQPMFEALAIMNWLGDRYGVERGLWPAPSDPKRLTALAWTTWSYVTYGTELKFIVRSGGERVPPELHNAAQVTASRKTLKSLLDMLEAQLTKGPFILGDSFSLADVVVGATVHYGSLFGVVPEGQPRVSAWLEAFRQRPAFTEAWAAAPRQV